MRTVNNVDRNEKERREKSICRQCYRKGFKKRKEAKDE